MKPHFTKKARRSCESGQAMILMLLIFSLVMLGAIAFAVDMGMLWYHRQSAQNAADAACVAGAMDILVNAAGSATGNQGYSFTGNTDNCGYSAAVNNGFHCSAKPGAVPCIYATRNGYDGKGFTPGNDVCVSFPGAAQMTAVPTASVPGSALVPQAFMRVDITDHVQTWFAGLLNGRTTRDVRAFAACGSVLESAPVPIVVLHPTQNSSLQGNGTKGEIKILGGPSRSIEDNSGSTTAVGFGGKIDLSQGGPNYDGSQLGTFGGPPTPTGTFLPGPSYWINHAAPIVDPFQSIPTPTVPAAPATPSDLTTNTNCNTSAKIKAGSCVINYRTGTIGTAHGCPDPGGCVLFTAGYYDSGLNLGGGGNRTTYLFDPGLYYIKDGFQAAANTVLRTSTFTPPSPNDIKGNIFYLTGKTVSCGASSKGLVCITSDSGKKAASPPGPSPAVDTFDIFRSQCPGGGPVDPKLLAALTKNGTAYTGLNGNLLLAPCTGPYGLTIDGLTYRGILFFQDHASGGDSAFGGGGSSLAAGSFYFHQTSGFGANLQLQGNSGETSFVLGEIVVDTLGMGGTPTIDMVLNPSKTSSILKATLLPWSSTN